jgi:uncharacterized protein
MQPIHSTLRTQIRRRSNRGSYDRAEIHAILDEAPICHIGFAEEGQPYVLPMAYARLGDRLYVHGAVGNRMLAVMRTGTHVCVTVTILDGLVLARSAFHHSMNYRSVVILGVSHEVTDSAEKRAALDAIVDHVIPGRAAETRAPSQEELAATRVLWLPITEASAKIRRGPPVDDEDDHTLPYWAGEIPMRLVAQAPIPDPLLAPDIALPASVRRHGDRDD